MFCNLRKEILLGLILLPVYTIIPHDKFQDQEQKRHSLDIPWIHWTCVTKRSDHRGSGQIVKNQNVVCQSL